MAQTICQTKEAYQCLACPKAAEEGYACCSKECRSKVPNCGIPGCGKATVPGIHKGLANWSQHCYKHEGRVVWDKEVMTGDFAVRKKQMFVLTALGWYPLTLNV
jgi:hypothetical protein